MNFNTRQSSILLTFIMLLCFPLGVSAQQGSWTLVGWNDLGMHCMDADYSVMAILPPYNVIHAQLISPSGQIVDQPNGIVVSYEAVADPAGSINSTSVGKSNFWDFVQSLFGVPLAEDEGLAGFDMPGGGNTPQAMAWDASWSWFTAEGIPLTPQADGGETNYYPMMRLVARDAQGTVLATTDIVLPVSDEMDCRSCHASGAGAAARPAGGWVGDSNPERDYRLNILRLHDEMEAGNPVFEDALTAVGADPTGLEATVAGGGSILCASCHPTNALPGSGVGNVGPLTRAIHGLHAGVEDPLGGGTLGNADNRSACYRCHPGSETRCLRGAMGNAVASNGSLAIDCQNCHGGMSRVGSPDREGWLDEPTCQQCHTGTATLNSGEIRFANAFSSSGLPREAADPIFATTPDTPAPGKSLFRFSSGHGGLQCEACHGSTHAIFPSATVNDGVQNLNLQGHVGTLVECSSCHGVSPSTINGGPHGMHPVGQPWVSGHHDAVGDGGVGVAECRNCHGGDLRGTVLSRSHQDRILQTNFGEKNFWRGHQIGCYSCHNGPDNGNPNPDHPPQVSDLQLQAETGMEVASTVQISDPEGDSLSPRVVSQPQGGRAWFEGGLLHYRSESGFSGVDSFTIAAFDGMKDSNLARVQVDVSASSGIFSDGFESGTIVNWN